MSHVSRTSLGRRGSRKRWGVSSRASTKSSSSRSSTLQTSTSTAGPRRSPRCRATSTTALLPVARASSSSLCSMRYAESTLFSKSVCWRFSTEAAESSATKDWPSALRAHTPRAGSSEGESRSPSSRSSSMCASARDVVASSGATNQLGMHARMTKQCSSAESTEPVAVTPRSAMEHARAKSSHESPIPRVSKSSLTSKPSLSLERYHVTTESPDSALRKPSSTRTTSIARASLLAYVRRRMVSSRSGLR
eukprot:Amastigsp_a177855_19.p2 type:complete len:250 gc:universal Amastigsp_a177855_19:588-1337(+)